jgi:N-carbamoyl-L-amino-acid hydrolase
VTAVDLLAEIADVGADRARGGYSRHVFDDAERTLREWFTEQAQRRGLDVAADGNGNLWAWWGEPGPDALLTGSHLDSVPGGGAFDGPLGVACALEAVDLLQDQGFRPSRPFAVVVFAEEEGGRFGLPCLGSKLLTGAVSAEAALALRDPAGVSLAEAAAAAGLDPARMGQDEQALGRIGAYVELHVEQGRLLTPHGAALGVADSILAHGRWRFTVRGHGNHAGTTEIADRHDPMLPAAAAVLAARRAARGDARATVGRLVPNPGGTNVIASAVDFWLDARSSTTEDTRGLVDDVIAAAQEAAAAEGCVVEVREESYGDRVDFDAGLRDRLAAELAVPVVPTGAGHDAGVLAAVAPTAMLFVRNPSGVSHAPDEHAEPEDCRAGSAALADVLRGLDR